MADIDLTNNTSASRYEARVGGVIAGYATYEIADDVVVFTHTEVDKSFEGKGIASALIKFGLDDVAAADRKAIPTCPYVKAWIGKHPDYAKVAYGS